MNQIDVLDYGFVRLVAHMGDDSAIVQAARVSYGAGTKTPSDDESLIRYLMRHQHTTPFEMCLSGDTRIPTFPCSGAKVKHYTMRQLADAFEKGGRENSWVRLIKIRTVNPDTRVVTATKIKNAWRTGFQPVYRVTTEAPFRRSIKVTGNHPILTPEGFSTIDLGLNVGCLIMLNGIPAFPDDVVKEIQRRRSEGQSIQDVSEALGISPSGVYKHAPGRSRRKTGFLRKDVGTHVDPRSIARRRFSLGECSAIDCEKPASDRHHIDENPHNNEPENVTGLCASHHRHVHTMSVMKVAIPCRISSIEFVGVEEVFDLEVFDSNHTFVADGVVVHNCEVKLHVKLPIFVARQWIRHRTASVNEYSARYSVMEREFYVPGPNEIATQSSGNKQGRGERLSIPKANKIVEDMTFFSDSAFDLYEEFAHDDKLARELARTVLPVNFYTQWYWKCDLHNLFHFLKLRLDPHAQYEIRAYAEAIAGIVKGLFPMAWRAFEDYRLNAVTFSGPAMAALRRVLAGEIVDRPENMSEREWREFQTVIAMEGTEK